MRSSTNNVFKFPHIVDDLYNYYKEPSLFFGDLLRKRYPFVTKSVTPFSDYLKQGRPTCNPKTFLSGPNWSLNLKNYRYFDHIYSDFDRKYTNYTHLQI
jgi:hypothetical protein